MRHLFVLSLLFAGGCTDQPTANVSVGWSLQGGNCTDLAVHKAGAALVDEDGSSIGGGCLACENALLVIEDVPYGTYSLRVRAMDDNLVVVGTGESTVEVGKTDDGYVSAGATVRVEKPGVKLRTRWKLTKHGAPTTCADLGNPQVALYTSSGYYVKYACDATDVTVDIAQGPVSMWAALVDATDKVLGMSQPVDVPIVRGERNIDLVLDADGS
jgi:hypothetical protein